MIIKLPLNAADLQCRLNSIGILTPSNLIGLDNRRTLQIHLHANDENGKMLIQLVKPSDTLGKVNKACNDFHCLEMKQRLIITVDIEKGNIKSLDDVLDKMGKLKSKGIQKSR